MPALHESQTTDQGMLPQSPALEFTSADTPRVGTKRGVDGGSMIRHTVVQHGRGETGHGVTNPLQRHPATSDSSDRAGERGRETSPVVPDVPATDITATPAAPASPAVPRTRAPYVFVLDRRGRPLMPCHPARARKLLKAGRARVHHVAPFVIRLVDRLDEDSRVDGVEVGIDPGSKSTGVSVFTDQRGVRTGLVGVEVQHRGGLIHKKMQQRANYRRRRRSANLRYRAPRFDNRTKPRGWLASSVQHRVDSTASVVNRIRRYAPVTVLHQETTAFDNQKMQDPTTCGLDYQRGTLFGFEVRAYLREAFNYACAYCGAKNVRLEIDLIIPAAQGGSSRVSNLALACRACNHAKAALDLTEWAKDYFGPVRGATIAARVRSQLKTPLRDAAVMNATRYALQRRLESTGLTVVTATGARTAWNRRQCNVEKTHTLDALCVGELTGVAIYPDRVLVAASTGRGTYARTVPDAYGFPRLTRPRIKTVFGFATGDHVRAVVVRGKHQGVHVGRVAVRTSRSFNIATHHRTLQGINAKHCQMLQRNDGWRWSTQKEGIDNAA